MEKIEELEDKNYTSKSGDIPEYDLEAMRIAVEQCDKNIEVFNKAIAKELETKDDYQVILNHLQRKADAQIVITLNEE